MIGHTDPRLLGTGSTYLSPIQHLRSIPSQPNSPSSYSHGASSMSEYPQSQDSIPFREMVSIPSTISPYEKSTLSQQYILSLANQINTLRKINRHLISSNELMDEFVTTKGGTAIELRALLTPLFTDIELFLTSNLNELLKAQKNFANMNSTSSTTNTSSALSFNRPTLPSTVSTLPPDPPVANSVFQPNKLERLDHSFNFINEKRFDTPGHSYSDPPHYMNSPLPTNLQFNPTMESTDTFLSNSSLFEMPSYKRNSIDFEAENQARFTSSNVSSTPSFQAQTLASHKSVFPDVAETMDVFQKLGFQSEPRLTSQVASPSLAPKQKGYDHVSLFPAPELLDGFPSSTAHAEFPFGGNETLPNGGFEQSSRGFHLGPIKAPPQEKTVDVSKPLESVSDLHLEMVLKDLKQSFEAERDIRTEQPAASLKELESCMQYHALAIARQKSESPVKFDHASLRQDLKSYAKLHRAAFDYELNFLAINICILENNFTTFQSAVQDADHLDKNILVVCNTIMSTEKLPLRVFSFLYVLIPQLRNAFLSAELLSEVPTSLKQFIQNKKSTVPLSIFFSSLSILRGNECGLFEKFFLNPVFKASQVILSKKPPKDSEDFQFVMTIIELASYHLSLYDSSRFETLQAILQEHYGLTEDEFGYIDPDKLWPFFVKKDDWAVEEVDGYYIQYASDNSLRRLNHEALGLSMDPNVHFDKHMSFKLRPIFQEIVPEFKWVKKACRVTKQALQIFQKEKERLFLSNVICIWILRAESQIVNLETLSQDQLQHLCQVLLHIFVSYRVFKLALFHTLFHSCRLLVPGTTSEVDISPERVVAYGRFWATLATTIPWFGEPNSYFLTPIILLFSNMPSHPHSELLVLTVLEISEPVLLKYKPGLHSEVLSKLCEKYPVVNKKYQKSPSVLLTPSLPEPVQENSSKFQAKLNEIANQINSLTRDKISSLSKTISDCLSSTEKTFESKEILDTIVTCILDRMQTCKQSDCQDVIIFGEFASQLTEKHTTFYSTFLVKLLDRCPLLNMRIPLPLIGNPEKLEKCLALIQLFIIMENYALIRGSTVMNASFVMSWYEHVSRSAITKETALILTSALRVSSNFLSFERFRSLLGYIRDKIIPDLPASSAKDSLIEIISHVFQMFKEAKEKEDLDH